MSMFDSLANPPRNRPGDPTGQLVDARMSYAQAMALKQRSLDGQPVDEDALALASKVIKETRARMRDSGDAYAYRPEVAPTAPEARKEWPFPNDPPAEPEDSGAGVCVVTAAPGTMLAQMLQELEPLVAPASPAVKPDQRCDGCGGPRAYGASKLCRACYRQRAAERQAVRTASRSKPSTDLSRYGGRLRWAMSQAGISASTLADKIFCVAQTIYAVLGGSADKLGDARSAKAAEVLGVRAEWLLTGQGNPLACTPTAGGQALDIPQFVSQQPTAKLHVMRETNLRDIPATLRNIADAIESGTHGEATGCVVVLDALRIEVFYTGSGEAAPNAHLLLHAGAAKMLATVVEAKA